MPAKRSGWWGRSGPECVLALVAALGFLGALGSTELWGRREQRAAAEAVDAAAHGRWLVGSIQGRPRLEKPPLPRWIAAGLILLTGRRDEAIVRLPDACAGLALVGIAVAWGRRAGGRSVGLAAGFALAATPFFLVEMRQAGNDGLLALAVGGTLWAALRRWGPDGGPGFERPGPAGWTWLFHLALGLGFLCKGPVVFLWVVVPVLGVLASSGRLREGLRLLRSGPALVALIVLVAAWPLAVAARHPAAWGVWALEIGQKAGGLGVEHGNERGSILGEALVAALPWTPLVLAALVGPLLRWRARRRDPAPAAATTPAPLALAWWWAFAPLAALGAWDVAKPNYLLPAAPAWAILAGQGWVRLAARARERAGGLPGRLTLQATWSGLFALAIVAPVATRELAPGWLGAAAVAGLAVGAAAVAGAWFWHRGRDAASLGALATGLVAVALLGFGVVAPGQNPGRGHRLLAGELARRLPGGVPAWFFDDLDEGIWFYGPGLDLRPVPASAATGFPATNRGHALRATVAPHRGRAEVARARAVAAAGRIAAWAEASGPGAHLLIRAKLLDHLAADLPPNLAPVYREADVERNAVALLRVRTPAEVAALPVPPRR